MYNSFFGFKERPFQLVPNPAYLFLSKSHEEAMAHLIYAISQGDGFVEITGEVGTGKTTLCRAFLENLAKDTEAAYIFNPKLDSLQLLKAINDEFGISFAEDNAKDLIDILNAFLLRKKAEGKPVILLIDEAQNLNKDVLEQLRLLSNLETNTSKLLQIVLVGQPELAEMLDSRELRQLAQRVTLSCHLRPLNTKETGEYIRHRIHVASQKADVTFTNSACRAIHKYSSGIPRLINIACDRALLTAFGLNKHRITGSLAKASVRELTDRGDLKRLSFHESRKGAFIIASSIALFIALLYVVSLTVIFYRPGDFFLSKLFGAADTERPKITHKVPALKGAQEKATPDASLTKETEKPAPTNIPGESREEPSAEEKASSPEAKGIAGGLRLSDALKEMNPKSSRMSALGAALKLWNEQAKVNPLLHDVEDDQIFFRLGAKQQGLQVYRVEGDISLMRKLNHPAILEFRTPGSLGSCYLALTKIYPTGMALSGESKDGLMEADVDQIRRYWTRVAYVLWKDFLNYPGVISGSSPGESIVALKMLLHEMGYRDLDMSPTFDAKTRETVKRIQEEHGLHADGVVGPQTKMVLYSKKQFSAVPRITGG